MKFKLTQNTYLTVMQADNVPFNRQYYEGEEFEFLLYFDGFASLKAPDGEHVFVPRDKINFMFERIPTKVTAIKDAKWGDDDDEDF